MARAAIDIGSNSLLLTVVDDTGAVLHDEVRIVGLGKGLGDRGEMAPDRLAAAEQVLRDFVIIAKRHGVEPWTVRAAATSAARRATNAEVFFARIHRETGIRVRILSGEEEAELTWIGAQRDLTLGTPTPGNATSEGVDREIRAAVDLGGGSTELVIGEPARILHRVSLEIGTVRLTEACLLGDDGRIPDRFPASGIAALVARVDERVQAGVAPGLPRPTAAIAVAGTATTLCAMALGLAQYDGARVHGAELGRDRLGAFVRVLGQADARERRALAAVSPERADYLLAGAVILERMLVALDLPHFVVSDRGLRFGLLA